MIFNQFEFMFVFLPLTLAAFFMPGLRGLRPYALLGASLIFYGISGVEHAIVLAVEVIWVYTLTRTSRIVGNRPLLTLAVLPLALALVYYKYLGFLVRSVLGGNAQASEVFHLFGSTLLPAGISFFTFNLVSFAVDRYRGQINVPPPFMRFALFITFFPHLVAGPILRLHDVADALARLCGFRLTREDASVAIGYICVGLFVKVLIADTLGRSLDPMAADPAHLAATGAVYVTLAYSFQIYFDFYGYSLCAIGLAQLFGVHFPRNFDRPYTSRNPREFWRRWHMTLSYWIRDYLYLPLGGNDRYVRNILIVFALCGLWHGAGWNFVAWGLYHGVLVIAYHLWGRSSWDRLSVLVQQTATFVLVSLGWILFLFDFEGAAHLGKSLVGMSDATLPLPRMEDWMILLIAVAVCFGFKPELAVEAPSSSRAGSYLRTATFAIALVAAVLFFDRSQAFIYFRF